MKSRLLLLGAAALVVASFMVHPRHTVAAVVLSVAVDQAVGRRTAAALLTLLLALVPAGLTVGGAT